MSLARDWTRQLYQASGAALLAPVTMIAALAVLALGGGFGGLGALGQLLSGPAVPVGAPALGARVPSQSVPPLLPVVPAAGPAIAATVRAGAVGAPSPPPLTRGGGARGSGGGGGQRLGSGGPGKARPPTRTTSTPTQPAAPVATPPPPPSPPQPTLVDRVVAAGEAVTGELPAPVSTLGATVLSSLDHVLNKLLPPL